MTRHRTGAIALALLFCVLAGCDKKSTGGNTPPAEPPPGPTGPGVASGPQGLYDQHCAKCHPSGGAAEGGLRKGMKGPNLTKIGAEHDADWIAEHIRNPRGHEPGSRMPQFEGKLKPEEIRSLAEFLAAKK
jgi:mono/diheme cytochrome c family protein